MQRFKNLNNISDELMAKIPKLKEGEEVVLQMLNGNPNHDPDKSARDAQPFLYGKTQIPTKSRIKDPFTNQIVDIGVPMAVENGEVKSFRPFLAGMEDDIFNGKVSLWGGRVQDEEFFEVFWLLNENASNPYRDKSIKPLFKIVNYKEESQKTLNKIEVLKKALDTLGNLKDSEYQKIAYSQNWAGDIDDLKAKVSEFAKSNPDKFLNLVDDPNTEIKANVKKAMDKGVLGVDLVSGRVTVGDNELFTIAKENLSDVLGAVARWINSATNGKNVYEGILKQLK